jgi:hypothetical protein
MLSLSKHGEGSFISLLNQAPRHPFVLASIFFISRTL